MHSKNFNANTPNKSTERNQIRQNERKSIKIDSVAGVLNLFNPHMHEIFLQLSCMKWVLGNPQKEILN